MPQATISKVYEERQLRLKTRHGRDHIVPTRGFPSCRILTAHVVFAQVVLCRSAFSKLPRATYFAYYLNLDFSAGAAGNTYYFELKSCRNVLRILLLYLKVTTLQLELRGRTSGTILVLKSCDFAAGLKVATLQPDPCRRARADREDSHGNIARAI